jgi:hypothetical protein
MAVTARKAAHDEFAQRDSRDKSSVPVRRETGIYQQETFTGHGAIAYLTL